MRLVHELDQDVFSKAPFKTYAKERLVLVEVDFPDAKRISAKTEKQNEELKAKYKVENFPTLILIDAEGKAVRRIGGYDADTLAVLQKAEAASRPR